MVQLSLAVWDNRNLFSAYYLENKVRTSSEWGKTDHAGAFSKIKEIYDSERKSLSTYNEAQLIKHFLDPIFDALLYESEVEEAAGSEFPDFVFFKDRATREEAHKNKGTTSFYKNALAIGEVKKWELELDGKPSKQLWDYLDNTGLKWGILTNGRKWRLYCRQKKRDDYYEIDLPSLLENNNIEGFRYFYYFFRRDAFLPLPEVFIEQVLQGSADHAKAIGNNLKENVYKAMKIIADGFFARPQNNLDRYKEEDRGRVQKNTMLLLYRLLFLLYAEDRNLLDLKNTKYLENHSFYRIKKEVEGKRGGYDSLGTSIWDRLKNLFELINLGSEALGEREFHVPAYNGGLFDTAKNPELEKWKIGDRYLAEAIHLLTWSDVNGSGFVDYQDLEIRHLGSIYEGLLEYKLKVAEADKVTKENEWVSLEKYNEGRKQKKAFEEFDEFSRTKKGELYLATDKGERKATGSYYTPDYIVNYIVKNTIEPVIEEKWKEAEAKKQSFVEAALSVKVLDPAMGSGHFLVGAVEFLADKLIDAAQRDIEAGRIKEEQRFQDKGWARREVVAHCIYGVDLNPMAVELAKVALWLTTISKDKPLSFLDHRLKQGNSLIGAQLEELSYYPDVKGKKKERKKDEAQQTFEVEIERPFFDKIIKILKSLTDISDDSIENIHKKKDIFEKLMASPEYQRIKAFANLHTSIYFGVVTTKVDRLPKDGYNDILWALREDEEGWRRKTNREWFGKARKLAEEKSFFHWELEFPEIFFEGGAPKENPGWDAVVGNPPYVRQEEIGDLKRVLKEGYETFISTADLYVYFYERGHKILRLGGYFGFISSNKFIRVNYGKPLRKFLSDNTYIKEIIDFGELPVFEDASTFPVIILTKKDKAKARGTIFTQVQSLDFPSIDFVVASKGIELSQAALAGDNWSLGDEKINKIISKMEEISTQLNTYIDGKIRRGILTGLSEAFVIDSHTREGLILEDPKSLEIIKPFIVGDDMGRYEIKFNDTYLIWTYIGVDIEKYPAIKKHLTRYKEKLEKRWDKGNYWWELRHCDYYEDFEKPKIMWAVITKKPKWTIDELGYYSNNATFFIPRKDFYLLAVLNSKLVWTYLTHIAYTIGDPKKGGRLQLLGQYMEPLPIRRISFTTPPARRAALFEEAKALYSAEAPDGKDLDGINRMDRINPALNPVNPVHPVQSSTSISTAPYSQKILGFVEARLSAAPEESDVVHDLLAHLAERMIEMNKTKNEEIKGFLRWLGGEIGAHVEELSNKTAIKEYYDPARSFEALVKALEKNKKKLKEGYDPTLRKHKDRLADEFNASMGKLAPLMRRIEATDGLIDAIVYRLYGLTEDEIKIVEESISGDKDREVSK